VSVQGFKLARCRCASPHQWTEDCPEYARARKYFDPDCALCQRWKGKGPAHEASSRCESGGDPHCACDTCF
jgi:hypothetical protein